jgi:hypothetical protein
MTPASIYITDGAHPAQRKNGLRAAVLDRHGAAHETGIAALRHDGDSMFVAELEHLRRLIGGAGQEDRR